MPKAPCVPMPKDAFFWYGFVLALLGVLLLRYLKVL
jgi:hypothetical protein